MKPGDVVRLKSGGPSMTVEFVKPELVWVVWFADPDYLTVCREKFSVESLRLEPAK